MLAFGTGYLANAMDDIEDWIGQQDKQIYHGKYDVKLHATPLKERPASL
jgi:hypothetical protein